MCPMLGEKDGKRPCLVHNTDNYTWNIGCRHWPSIPEHTAHLPRCTFTWKWVDGR